MVSPMDQCVYCESTDNLNTQLTVTLEDGNKVTVNICDAHAEEATIKTARAAYLEKQQKINEIIEQAKKLGLEIGQSAGGLVIAQQTTPQSPSTGPAPQPKPTQPKPPKIELSSDDPDVVQTTKIDSNRQFVSLGGSTDHGHVDSYSSHDLNIKGLPPEARDGYAQMRIVEGREGHPIAIPQKRIDGTGVTRINIKQIEDDRGLQNRFKKMANQSMRDDIDGTPNFARSGYRNSTRDCPICRGECVINGQDCPKCNGAGVISVY